MTNKVKLIERSVNLAVKHSGSITIVTSDTVITGVKSVQTWGNGLFYGLKLCQKSFTKSVHIDDIVLFKQGE